MALFNTKLEFIGSGQIKADVDTILFEDTFLTGTLAVAEAGHADLDVRFVNNSILGALNELLDGLISTSGDTSCFVSSVDTEAFVHTVTHNLDSFDLLVAMYDGNPASGPVSSNVIASWTPLDANSVRIELDAAASGHFVILGCPATTISSLQPVDARPAVASIIPDASGVHDLGSDEFKWNVIIANSGTFEDVAIDGEMFSKSIFVSDDLNKTQLLYENKHPAFGNAFEIMNLDSPGTSAFNFLSTRSDGATALNIRHNLRGDGAIFSDIAATTPADYAEYFEAADPAGIEPGYAVTLSTNDRIDIANSGDYILGVVSAAPAYLADSAWSSWHDKYLKDDFGAYIRNEKGEQTLNPVWSSGTEYIPREDRPEWITVGMVGKLWVRHYGNQPLYSDFVAVGVSGMMQKATDESQQWLVIASGISFDPTKGYGTTRILYK